MSREAHSADAGSSEKPHGEVPRGWAQGRIQSKKARDQEQRKEKKTRTITALNGKGYYKKSKYNGVERQGESRETK